ncbi:hypothetical protein QBC47DRAFT_83804 [Echria macrotheca]|uniref:Centrosomin N-terminal motif 1 domain-containing protein n=1 Tax=Echria macrotheca TaxID=438768 RepID=A0AAJ0B7Y6_9PEZI|nr:hypothetical protein QBC47DRAFT_83804 [Echria macrotheca]
MDAASSQSQMSDRSRPPYPRTASRSSTSSTRTRMSNNSAASSQQQLPSTTSSRHPYQRTTRPPTIDRPRSQLSREASEQSRESLPTMSTYLQERLERERRVNESERSSSHTSNDAVSMPADMRAIQSSPPRKSAADGRRPRSSGGTEPAKKKGLGVKEMEQTLSTLHKQNFDLKLELFHRREKQTALEERVEKLESEKARTDEMNDQLIQELEKRDKAVEEAVAMIVVLEARVEQLIREREMVRRVEHDGLFYSRGETPRPEATPKSKMLDLAQFDDFRALNRMPSFLSERSENTANLRNVYLGVRGSVVSLPRMAEDAHEAERMEHNGVSSPSLSVLSESSFLSIYGQKHAAGADSPAGGSPPSVDGPSRARGPSMSESIASVKSLTPSKPRRTSASRNMYQNIHGILDVSGSPLQRLERLEMTITAMDEASRPPTSNQDAAAAPPPPIQTVVSQSKTKQEKREALQKVLTQLHQEREFMQNHALPPTPDTISTSTLRRFKNSNDTLSRGQSLTNERSYLALSETTASQVSGAGEETDGTHLGAPQQTTQPASTTAFDSRKPLMGSGAPLDRELSPSPQLRPQSAGATTISRRGGKDGWDSDSDDDFANEVDSMASSFDPWLRESLKPNRGALDPMSSASQAGPNKNAGRASPDLFSFPVSSGGWASDAMYGHLGGAAYMGTVGNGISAPMAEALDALGSSLPSPFFGSGFATPVIGPGNAPPPPPNRRSSLHAQTGPTAGAYSSGSVPASPAKPSPMSSRLKKSPTRRDRSGSVDLRPTPSHLREIGLRQDRSMTVPPRPHHQPPPQQSQEAQSPAQQPLPKQRHYPPTASQAPRPRGLNSLFRRSTGSAEPPQPAPSSAPATETTFRNLPSQMGYPSCGKRSSLIEDDRASATPPPILRNKAQQRLDLDEGGGAPLEPSGGAPIGPIPGPARPVTSGSGPNSASLGNSAAVTSGPPARAEGGGKLKWLGLGRVSSLRNRGA